MIFFHISITESTQSGLGGQGKEGIHGPWTMGDIPSVKKRVLIKGHVHRAIVSIIFYTLYLHILCRAVDLKGENYHLFLGGRGINRCFQMYPNCYQNDQSFCIPWVKDKILLDISGGKGEPNNF